MFIGNQITIGLKFSDSGNFILHIGGVTNSENFLPLPKNANMLIVRQTYETLKAYL